MHELKLKLPPVLYSVTCPGQPSGCGGSMSQVDAGLMTSRPTRTLGAIASASSRPDEAGRGHPRGRLCDA